MPIGSTTTDIVMINLVMTGADGVGGVWQDEVQLIPLGMYDDPVDFVARIRAGLPLVNNLRVLFNEHSFNPDGSMHPQMEAFLAAAVAQGFDLTMVYGEGDAQNIGIGSGRWPDLTNAEAYAALDANYADMAGAWTQMLDWMDAHPVVEAGVYGWELMNESAGYRHSIRNNGAGDGLTATDFVQLYTNHALALADLIDARAAGRILVGGWGYNGDFLTLANTLLNGQSAIDVIRAGVGADLVWSAHLYPGWMETDLATTPAELIARLTEVYAPITGDDVLITEINADGQIDNPAGAPNYADFYAASYEWFAANGIGLGWYPGVQTGASHLLYLEGNGNLSYRHQHSVAHAMNAFSLGFEPLGTSGHQSLTPDLITVRLRNESYETAAGEPLFDTIGQAGFAFGYAGNDTLTGTDQSNDFLYGGRGHDQILGGAGDDFLFGQFGNDRFQGGAGIDNMFGGQGNDVLDGGAGNDYMAGGQHHDHYYVSEAADAVVEFAAEGTDTVFTSLSSYALGAFLERLTFDGVGNFQGTGNDLYNIVTGGAGADLLTGLAGRDTLNGNAGNDILIGGSGGDRLSGGSGVDAASYITGTRGVVVDMITPTGSGAFDAAGDVYSSIENIIGSNFADIIAGDTRGNVLNGMAGNDVLRGREGVDQLYGDAGADQFVFSLGWQADRVMDFEDNIDTLVFEGIAGLVTAADALAHARMSGAHTLFDFGNGDTFMIVNTNLALLADDILILP